MNALTLFGSILYSIFALVCCAENMKEVLQKEDLLRMKSVPLETMPTSATTRARNSEPNWWTGGSMKPTSKSSARTRTPSRRQKTSPFVSPVLSQPSSYSYYAPSSVPTVAINDDCFDCPPVQTPSSPPSCSTADETPSFRPTSNKSGPQSPPTDCGPSKGKPKPGHSSADDDHDDVGSVSKDKPKSKPKGKPANIFQ